MKLLITYWVEIPPRQDGSVLSVQDLIEFEKASGAKLARFGSDRPVPTLATSGFIKDAPEHHRFLRAAEEFGLNMGEGTVIGVYDNEDYEKAELLYGNLPETSKKIHKSPHPGTLLYRGNPPKFVGYERIESGGMYDFCSKCSSPPPFGEAPLEVDSQPLLTRPIVESSALPTAFVRDDLKQRWEEAGVSGVAYWECHETAKDAKPRPRIWGLVVADEVPTVVSETPDLRNGEPVFRLLRHEIAQVGSISTLTVPPRGLPALLFKPDVYQIMKNVKDIIWLPVELVD